MFEAYTDLREQLEADVREAWEFSEADKVFFGAPRKAWERYPHAIVKLEQIPRQHDGGRSVQETYQFQIEGRFPLPSDPNDVEADQVAKLRALGLLLAPAQSSAPGSPFPALPLYAGVAYERRVTEGNLGDDADDAKYFSVMLVFSVLSDVYQ